MVYDYEAIDVHYHLLDLKKFESQKSENLNPILHILKTVSKI